ncbi:MAG: hypothetical protein ABI461_23230 [Polyangiaceae bacterium]
MRRLRILAVESPSTDPKRELAELAARFPGALREIDELPLATIDHRLLALSNAIADPKCAESWMEAVALFHTLTRGALSAKRFLAGKKAVDPHVRASYEKSLEGAVDAEAALVWIDHLEAIANPPRGRVTDLVYPRIAEQLGISVADARRIVFK